MSGWIHVITGPMYSGKTGMLLHLLRRYEIAGKKPVLFRPAIDTRTDEVVSRTGLTFPAHSINSLQDFDKLFYYGYKPLAPGVKVVAFDEAQFFDEFISDLVEELVFNGYLVLVSGLERNFLTTVFGEMGNLLVQADEVTKLSAICTICHEDATLTQRLINGQPAKMSDPLILVGGMGDDTYEARCRNHHEIGV